MYVVEVVVEEGKLGSEFGRRTGLRATDILGAQRTCSKFNQYTVKSRGVLCERVVSGGAEVAGLIGFL